MEVTTSIAQVFRSPAEVSLKEALTMAFQQLEAQGIAAHSAV